MSGKGWEERITAGDERRRRDKDKEEEEEKLEGKKGWGDKREREE